MHVLPPLPGPVDGLRIGLFGGSFNPAHDGHLHVSETALRTLDLDWIWWLVALGNPLKSHHGDYDARLASARSIVRHPRMIVTPIEAQLGHRYTADTLKALTARAPTAQFVWMIGADSLCNFHLWKNWTAIAEQTPIAVIARPGASQCARQSPFAKRFASARLPQYAAKALPTSQAPAWTFINAPLNKLSSTALRREQKD